MENSEMKSTPMGHIWFMVLLSMCFVFGASWIWHVSGMNKEARHNKAVNDVVIANAEQIALYRDVLKVGKQDAVAPALPTPPLNNL